LEETKAQSTVVFLDACFSGAARDDSEHMLASARGVGVSANMKGPSGNMVVFSAASDDQTAYPYKEKNHGLFTYYLLKKLQESEGNVTLGELADYITRQVRQQSVVVNHKLQSPTITPSPSVASYWQSIVL
jgi:peptide deformylase